VHFLAILDYGWPCDLASEVDGENGETIRQRAPKVVAQEIDASDGKTAEMSLRDGN
jgi:hypothetical protein